MQRQQLAAQTTSSQHLARRRTPEAVVVVLVAMGLAVSIVLGAAGGTASAAGGRSVVQTTDGLVRGTVTESVRSFQGIPYAAPPVGELRWEHPQPPDRWRGLRDATEPAPACAQTQGELPEDSVAEDCLYLNVTTPSGRSSEPRPVIVWLHGGGFFQGAGHNYDAERLAVGGDVVVVTVNYRLGIFGNFGHPALDDSGSFGLADQQAALSWVQQNAAAFGGDPGKVTMAGQSAGAVSGCAHLTSPSAAGLFDRAIMQSGSCGLDWLDNFVYRNQPADSIFLPVETVAARGQQAAAELQCTASDPEVALSCLRDLPAEMLLPVSGQFVQPAYGHDLLPVEPAAALRDGRFHHVPVLSGHTRNESTLPTSMYEADLTPMTEQTYQTVMAETFGADEAAVAAEYPRSAYDSAALAWAAVVTDRKWATSQFDMAWSLSRHVPVYQYEFADPAPPTLTDEPLPMPLGAYHSSDLWSLFDLGGASPDLSPEQEQLSEQMIDYWSAFAATGDPGSADGPDWPAFRGTEVGPHVQQLAPGPDGIGPVDIAAQHHLQFWAQLSAGPSR